MKTTKIAHLPVTIERSDDGFLASCSLTQGVFSEGDTLEEALFNCLDVVKMILVYRDERGKPILKGNVEELKVKEKVSFTFPIEIQAWRLDYGDEVQAGQDRAGKTQRVTTNQLALLRRPLRSNFGVFRSGFGVIRSKVGAAFGASNQEVIGVVA